VVEVTSSVAPSALGLDPTPGFADWAVEWAARARVARAMGLRMAIVEIETLIWSRSRRIFQCQVGNSAHFYSFYMQISI
jgi:hypothetical protein